MILLVRMQKNINCRNAATHLIAFSIVGELVFQRHYLLGETATDQSFKDVLLFGLFELLLQLVSKQRKEFVYILLNHRVDRFTEPSQRVDEY